MLDRLSRHLMLSKRSGRALLWFVLVLICFFPEVVNAEWYVAGYGGYTAPSTLSDVEMNNYGETLAFQQFPGALPPDPIGTIALQDFKTSDVSLKSSPMFGAKLGYFFNDEGFSWLGVELEAYTSQPTIKNQTVSTTQNVIYLPFDPLPPGICFEGTTCQSQVTNSGTLKLSESSMRLIAVAFNVVARYPGKVFQPYVGVGAAGFYFTSTGQIDGHQVVPGLNLQAGVKLLATEEWGLFIEGKYNYATITNLDPTFGLSGQYSAVSGLAGIAYHF